MKSAPDSFYERFFGKLEDLDSRFNIGFLKEQLREARAGILRASIMWFVMISISGSI